jgi:hypothetical protein
MKLSASRIERMLEKVETTLVPPPRKCLSAIVHGDDEAEAKEKALAEHVAHHPEDVGLTVEDFNWIRSSAGLLDDSLTVEHGQRGFGSLVARTTPPPRADARGPLADINARRFAERDIMEYRQRIGLTPP